MLKVQELNRKFKELDNLIGYFRKDKTDNGIEYVRHLVRLREAYKKEREKALNRKPAEETEEFDDIFTYFHRNGELI